nr:unnamed protein product [Spirometra erinaceieuropaei]
MNLRTGSPKLAGPLAGSRRHGLHLSIKLKMCQAAILTTLLHGAETWIVCEQRVRKLNHFHRRCRQKVLKLRWEERIPDAERDDNHSPDAMTPSTASISISPDALPAKTATTSTHFTSVTSKSTPDDPLVTILTITNPTTRNMDLIATCFHCDRTFT